MILSSHALNRIEERILMPVGDVLLFLEDAYRNKEYSLRSPAWYDGAGYSMPSWEFQCWIGFKDADGIPCVAIMDATDELIVTVVKKTVWES